MDDKLRDIKDDELLEVFNYKYQHHLALANKYKKFIDALNGENPSIDSAAKGGKSQSAPLNEVTSDKKTKKTFEQIIIEILKDGNPRTTKMLMEDGAKFGLKSVPVKNFSSKLSISSKLGNIKNLKFPDHPVDERYWWGLKGWFVGDKFKDEYEVKIRNKYAQNNKPLLD